MLDTLVRDAWRDVDKQGPALYTVSTCYVSSGRRKGTLHKRRHSILPSLFKGIRERRIFPKVTGCSSVLPRSSFKCQLCLSRLGLRWIAPFRGRLEKHSTKLRSNFQGARLFLLLNRSAHVFPSIGIKPSMLIASTISLRPVEVTASISFYFKTRILVEPRKSLVDTPATL